MFLLHSVDSVGPPNNDAGNSVAGFCHSSRWGIDLLSLLPISFQELVLSSFQRGIMRLQWVGPAMDAGFPLVTVQTKHFNGFICCYP